MSQFPFSSQIYYGCEDCSSDFGLCYVCVKYCHKEGAFAKHKIKEVQQVGDFYCDCGSSGEGVVRPAFPRLIQIPG